MEDEHQINGFSLRAGELLGYMHGAKEVITVYYGEKPINDLEKILTELWIIARNKG